MALLPGETSFLYDVSDPVHPQAVCRIANTYARILTGTSFEYLVPRADGKTAVILHALGSNHETTETILDADLSSTNMGFYFSSVSMAPGSGTLAYQAAGGTDADGLSVTDIWVATATRRTKIYSYSVGGVDSFGRPGLPPPLLALSPDSQYLIAGWAIKGSNVRVFRLSDGTDVTPPMPSGMRLGLWAPAGHTLYLVGSTVEAWSPEAGASTVANTPPWVLAPNFSPDGMQVAFTELTSSRDVRPDVYDLTTRAGRRLIDQPRSAAIFVGSAWIWYLEEKPCVQTDNNTCFDPTTPDGKVLAFNLATRTESVAVFRAGESPSSGPGYVYLAPGDLWPRS